MILFVDDLRHLVDAKRQMGTCWRQNLAVKQSHVAIPAKLCVYQARSSAYCIRPCI